MLLATCFPLADMSDRFPDGVLSKPEALEKYHKPERTFQRRLANALRLRNEDFLKHFYLSTSDGKLRDGVEVADGEVERLKGEGLYPVWGVEEAWFRSEYDQPSRTREKKAKAVPADVQPEVNYSTLDRPALVGEVESLHEALDREKKHNQLLSDQLKIKDEQIKAANEIAMETNQREKEYSRLLKELTEVIKLAQGNRTEKVGQATGDAAAQPAQASEQPAQPTESKHPAVLDATLVADERATAGESAKAKQSPASKRRSPTRKKSSKKSSASRTTKAKTKKKSAAKASKPKWYQTPTIDRFLSRGK